MDEKENTVFISLPEPPCSACSSTRSIHQNNFDDGQGCCGRTYRNWENNLPECIKLAYLPAPGRVRLRLSARGDKEKLEATLEKA
jgi:nicotinamide-nucleotide amidase